MKKEPFVAIVGATGMVGRAMRDVIEKRGMKVSGMRLLASERSRGRSFPFRGRDIDVEVLDEGSFEGVDLALFSAGGSISKQFAPIAVAAGAVVVDNSSAWRMDPEVPLVVPEVNPGDVSWHKGIIANPNCSTIQMVVVLHPLNKEFRIRRVVVSTYQSVSGTGKEAVEELKRQIKEVDEGRPVSADVYPHQIAYNALPHIDVFMDDGYTREELKMTNESRKIMGEPDLALTATAVRVPVFVGHSESVNVQFEKPVTPELARSALSDAPGVQVIDDPTRNLYPLATDSEGKDPTYVGRIRTDFSIENALNMWIVSDNLLKGAALNAVQIAELLLR